MAKEQDTAQVHALLWMLKDHNLRFPERPRIIEDLRTFHMPDGLGVQFRGLEMPVIVRGLHAGAALGYLLPALDGTRTLEDLLAGCPESLPAGVMLQTVSLLHTKGLLAPSGGAAPAAV